MKPRPFLMALSVLICLQFIFTPAILGQDEKIYTVKKSDTLWDICQKYYNDPFLWPALWALNQDRLTNPHWISIGDSLIIYDKEALLKKKAEITPPSTAAAPAKEPKSLYERSKPIETIFPKYFTYLANPAGLENKGINRIRIKKVVFESKWVMDESNKLCRIDSKKIVNTYAEMREVGEIIASEERGFRPSWSGDIHGRSMLSFFDNVIVHFTENVALILDSADHGELDPYFREYPVYGLDREVKEPQDEKGKKSLGRLHRFKGVLTVVARIETSKVFTPEKKKKFLKKRKIIDREPIFYVARITQSKEPIEIGDRIFLFKRIE
ncbi:MAG: LysM peptidoglycan-binding domain-containing protein [Deltaproteobacteria bacterium]|nr:LysM peptidoglycan-binding domain-containing protein [Deltaproteobacteria bacterium]MBW2085465.1 LysM peptidoglycan-binding domain-containing protein [Deltaproteobacteria bacterium]